MGVEMLTAIPGGKCSYCGVLQTESHAAGCPRNYEGEEAQEALYLLREGETHAMMVPTKRGPHRENLSYLLGWNRVDGNFGSGDEPRVVSGSGFIREVPSEVAIDDIRKESIDFYGREIHIQAKIGPLELSEDGKQLGCPIKAVDDQFLSLKIRNFPQKENHYLLIGYFK